MEAAAVFVGGGLGSLCRYGIAVGARHWLGDFPVHTLLANALASLILGAALAYFTEFAQKNTLYALIAIGFCGGFSTFSSFSAESFSLFQSGQLGLAIVNIGGSVGVCLLAVAIGYWAVSGS